MTLKALRDLQMAGVQWEITDVPITLANAQQKQIQKKDSVNEIRNMADITKPVNTVVPPIAPVQTISIDTVSAMASRRAISSSAYLALFIIVTSIVF
jgi:hypothetical protein